jgi:polysaccharide export outer membrane protein
MRKCIILCLTTLLLASCAGSTQLGGAPGLQVIDAQELPPPEREDLTAADRPYLVGPFDSLLISVFGVPELTDKEIQVDASGRISYPMVGQLLVAGKTPVEIADLLAAGLASNYVRNPQVTVNLKETTSQVVTVEGEVKVPGLYPVVGRMTLMRTIAKAQGTGEFPNIEHVVVFRSLAALYDLKAIRLGAATDPDIYANDIVVVGESRSLRLFERVIRASPLITTPLIVAAQRL